MPETDDVALVTDATGLGAGVLAQVVETTSDGIILIDEAGRCVYVNPAACRMLGRPAAEIVGGDYVDIVAERHRPAARRFYGALLDGSTEMLTRMLVHGTPEEPSTVTRTLATVDAEEREVVLAPFRVDVAGRPHGGVLIRDFTESRAAGRAAGALAQSVAELVGSRSISEVLAGIARHAVEGTRAVWAGIALVDESGAFGPGGAFGPHGPDLGEGENYQVVSTAPAQRYLEAMTGGTLRVGGSPSRATTLARSTWEQDPVLSTYGRSVLDLEWEAAVTVPLAYDNQVVGALMAVLPPGVTSMDDAEVAFCTALADHAAVAAAHERLSTAGARSAELRERARVARELHDSVSQALFAMTMHARTAQLAMSRAGLDLGTPLARSVEELSQLSRGALAEMRALIFELRPESLGDEGLVAALRTLAAAISSREHVTVGVEGPATRLPVGADVEADLYRVAGEALQNVVRHADATTAVISVRLDGPVLRLDVTDDGVGLDPAVARTSTGGLAEVARRVHNLGGELTISGVDGTTLDVVVPLRP